MPFGVVTKILSHLCVNGPLALRHLLFASKGIYYTAINEGSLWTTISFDAEFCSHFRGRSVEQASNFTQQCLRRSNPRPLCIRLLFCNAFDRDLIAGFFQALKNSKYRGYQRCTSLIWCYGDMMPHGAVREIVALLPRKLPSLQQLCLDSFRDPPDLPPFPDCPVLDRVEILDHYEAYPAFWGTNFAHVTTLSFRNRNITTIRWRYYEIDKLSLFPGLRDLTLFTADTEAPEEGESQLKVQFQYLQILRVCGDIPPKILTCLVAPALEELHIKANTLHRTPIATLRYYSELLCQHLYARLPEAVSVEEPHWAEAFTGLVEKCTRLKTLHISKWMEEECQKFVGHYNIVLY